MKRRTGEVSEGDMMDAIYRSTKIILARVAVTSPKPTLVRPPLPPSKFMQEIAGGREKGMEWNRVIDSQPFPDLSKWATSHWPAVGTLPR